MPIITIPDKSVELAFPDDIDEDSISEAIYTQFPDMRPSAWKAGVEMAKQGYKDVLHNVKSTGKLMDVGHGMTGEEQEKFFNGKYVEKLKAAEARSEKEEAEYQVGKAESAAKVEKAMPTTLPGKIGAHIVGLAGQAPIYAAGGGVGGAVAKKLTANLGEKAAKTLIATGEGAGAFGGAAALKGEDLEEVAKETFVGAVTGPAKVLMPTGTKTVSEAAAMLGASALVHGTPITQEDFAVTLGTIVGLKLGVKGIQGVTAGVKKAVADGKLAKEKAAKVEEVLKSEEGQAAVKATTAVQPDARGFVEGKVKQQESARAAAEAADKAKLDTLLSPEKPVIVPIEGMKPATVPGVVESITSKEIPAYAAERVERRQDSVRRQEIGQMSYEDALKAVEFDSLTGVRSRRAWESKEPSPYTILLDLDSLKPANDKLGYNVGDKMLETTGKILQEEKVDAYRIGGDEFVIAAKTPAEAEAIVKRLRQRMKSASFDFEYNGKMTKSTRGIAASIGAGKTFAEAEALMKQEKSIKRAKRKLAAPKGQEGVLDMETLIPKRVLENVDRFGGKMRDLTKAIAMTYKDNGVRKALGPEFYSEKWVGFNKNMLTLLQFAESYPHVKGLQDYVNRTREHFHRKKVKLELPNERLKEWRELTPDESNTMTRLMLDETLAGRWEPAESARVKALSERAQLLRDKVYKDFADFLTEVEVTLIAKAEQRLTGKELADEVTAIRSEFNAMRDKPYFPFARWGDLFVQVKSKHGVDRFELFTSEAEQMIAYYKQRKAAKTGDIVSAGKLDESLIPFQMMPRRMVERVLDTMTDKMNLNKTQIEQLNAMVYKLNYGESFKKHFLERRGTLGFSEDGQRAYANYMVNGINHLMRIQDGEGFAGAIQSVRESSQKLRKHGLDSTSRDKLIRYMEEHNAYAMSSKNDWAAVRSFAFLFYLGYVPKTALINLLQVPTVTYPHLAATYGDAAAVRAITGAMRDVSFGLKGKRDSIKPEEFEAMLNSGVVDKSFITEVAGVTEGGLVMRTMSTSKTGSLIRSAADKAGIFMSLTEQANRRVTYLAAYRLAKEKGKDALEAREEARKVVEKTQYEYEDWNRPKFMRGKMSVVTLFMSYVQHTLYFALRDPGNKRFLGVLLAAAGVQGLPFAEDLLEVVDKLYTTKNVKFDSRQEMRKFAQELGMNPDLMMHGAARYGFGLPWLAEQAGGDMPNFDLSGSISLGRPTPFSGLLAADGYKEQLEAGARVAGAAAAIPLSIWSVMADDNPLTMKSAEKLLPKFMGNGLRAYSYATEGEHRNNQAATVAEFKDDKMIAAALAAAGVPLTEVTRSNEANRAKYETLRFYQERRKVLLNTLDRALAMSDPAAKKLAMAAIIQYNNEVPFPAMKLKSKSVNRSLDKQGTARHEFEQGYMKGKTGYSISQGINESYQEKE